MTVVNRGGVLERDDGVCHNTVQMQFFSGEGPSKVATCKPNEVEIPEVIGQSLADAKSRLQAQPLTPVVIYKPAKRAEKLGVVVAQFPAKGTASANDRVTIVLSFRASACASAPSSTSATCCTTRASRSALT